ncbi:IS982-like element ISDds5 family transposase [Deinococcus deserti]|uniref:Putative transposase n=1 Tax=Deinococcus deserti (strain DSM 17065 / CIP 109153 / LMG 22923 / VCD115) TaxID=546414 RepID=C1D3X7_DEIDV|nr:IS982-like element ISDds5 family transposase [Deinococcus deserti]ACO48206.1 putative transposase [Deinococcus deserti VCD115]
MARYRLHHSLGRRRVIRTLWRWGRKHFSDHRSCRHQKVTDAFLVALLLSRYVFKHPYPSIWWNILREDRPGLPSYTQAFTRGQRLLEHLEALVSPPLPCTDVVVDSMPLPVCRPKRGKRCAFPGARWGYGTQGDFFGFKLHAWVSPAGQVMQYLIRPANLHDTTVAYELNRRWADFGGPRVIGDKGYCALGFIYPPKKNTRYDTRWREDHHPKLRKRIETVFSQLVEAQVRSVQSKTLTSLRLRVVLAVLAHNLMHR